MASRGGAAGSWVRCRPCVGEAVAGEDDLLLHQQRCAAALDVIFRADRGLAPGGFIHHGRVLAVLVVHHAHFQRGGAAEDVLRLGGVLHAGQLHDDAVGALLLDHRLGDAELVDAVVQGGDVLLDGEFLDALLRLGLEDGGQLEVRAVLDFRQQQVGLGILDGGARLVARLGVAEADGELVAFAGDAGMAHAPVSHP